MSDIVKYVSSALARGIHQNAFAASCDDTQMPAGPDRCPQMKKAPDPTAPLPAPGGRRPSRQKIDAVSRLFCASSADLVKIYL